MEKVAESKSEGPKINISITLSRAALSDAPEGVAEISPAVRPRTRSVGAATPGKRQNIPNTFERSEASAARASLKTRWIWLIQTRGPFSIPFVVTAVSTELPDVMLQGQHPRRRGLTAPLDSPFQAGFTP